MRFHSTFLLCALLISCANEIQEPSGLILDTDNFFKHLEVLSDDRLLGRDTGSPGYDSASAYIENFIKIQGLLPGGTDSSYRQPITFRYSKLVPAAASVSIGHHALVPNTDFVMPAVSGIDSMNIKAPLVFAGLGIDNTQLGYSDFDDIEVAGKIAVVIREVPKHFGIVEQAVISSDQVLEKILRDKGALAIIRIIPESYYPVRSWSSILARARRPQLRYLSPLESDKRLPMVKINHQAAEHLFEQAGKNYTEILDSLLNGKSASFDFGFDAKLTARFSHKEITSHNLAAILPGTDPKLKNEYLVLTAHLDHIGVSPAIEGDSINNGTLDNASGSAALMVIAQTLKSMARKRSIIFLWVTAEEKGLLGSEYFTKYPALKNMNMVANLNIDGVIGMIVETKDVIAYGYEHSNLSESVDYALDKSGMYLSPDPQPELNIFVRSDQYSFVKRGIPALYVVSGRTAWDSREDGLKLFNHWLRNRYHKPSDDMDQPMSMSGIRKELNVNLSIAHHIANRPDSIKWNQDSFLYEMFVRN